MKRDTRREILDAARTLFNEKGFTQVSLRDISGALGISKGNLTYHFKKKEEIVEALLAESADKKPRSTPQNLAELDAFFLNMQRALEEHAYYFLHHAHLSQLSPAIREKQRARYLTNRRLLMESFALLHSQGLLREEVFKGEYEGIIDALHISCIYWRPFGELKQDAQLPYRDHARGLICGLLTEKGRAAF